MTSSRFAAHFALLLVTIVQAGCVRPPDRVLAEVKSVSTATLETQNGPPSPRIQAIERSGIERKLDGSTIGLLNMSDVPMKLTVIIGALPIVISLGPKQFGIFDIKGTHSIEINETGDGGAPQRIVAGQFYLVSKQEGRWVFREP